MPPAAVAAVPRIVVAGASSGVGKTSVACGVIRALRDGGVKNVQAFKVGPDYIDTGYLSEASGRPAANLDSWMMGRPGVVAEYGRMAEGAGAAVIEGVMGYYDGAGDAEGEHSTYHVARLLGAPVALVVDASRAGQSVAAVALGFKRYRAGSNIAGVVLNRIGSDRHERMCRAALEKAGIAVLGAVRRNPSLEIGTGRLGLAEARRAGGKRGIGRIAKGIARHLDAVALLKVARGAGALRADGGVAGAGPRRSGGGRAEPAAAAKAGKAASPVICVARDEAFSFYYHNSLENLRRAGAALRFFSPLADRRLPKCGMLYVGGGFPEEHAAGLEANEAMRRSIAEFAAGGGLVYAEGSGAAYLSKSIEYEGRAHAMAGVLDFEVGASSGRRLGYVEARVGAGGCIVAPEGAAVRGHAFHHMEARSVGSGAAFAYEISRGPAMRGKRRGRGRERTGVDGMVAGGVFASMMQAYIGPDAARRIVQAAAAGPAGG